MKQNQLIHLISFITVGVVFLSAFSSSNLNNEFSPIDNPEISTEEFAEIAQLPLQGINGETNSEADFKGKRLSDPTG